MIMVHTNSICDLSNQQMADISFLTMYENNAVCINTYKYNEEKILL